ncbi:hypothetical protein [Rhizobium phage RHEph12]|nr:hypothetical protein [Rhizobium phage RHEph12]
MPKIVKLSALKKGAKRTEERKPLKAPKGKKQEIADMPTIAEAIRQAAADRRERPNVDIFPSSIFLVYAVGLSSVMFYHIPMSEFEGKRGKRRYADIIAAHGYTLTDRSKKYWLHLALMPANMHGREEGEWYKYLIPDDEPFTIKGTFRVVSTGAT